MRRPKAKTSPTISRRRLTNDIIVISFAIISALLLALELSGTATAAQTAYIHAADLIIALFFLGEFIVRLYYAKSRKHFLMFRWWELLAAIPVTSLATQALRTVRVIRVIELFQVVRASARMETTGELLGEYTDYHYVLEAISTLLAVLFGAAVLFFALESPSNPNVHSLWDAFWWSSATLTTTGYGDIYPITAGGRILAICLMFTGVVAIAAFTGVMVTYLAERHRRPTKRR